MSRPSRSSDFEFRQMGTMSQKLAAKIPEFQDYAGTDREIAQSIAVFNILGKFGIIDMKDPGFALIKALLIEQNRASFATSEQTNEISKMGLLMPKNENIIEIEEDDD